MYFNNVLSSSPNHPILHPTLPYIYIPSSFPHLLKEKNTRKTADNRKWNSKQIKENKINEIKKIPN